MPRVSVNGKSKETVIPSDVRNLSSFGAAKRIDDARLFNVD